METSKNITPIRQVKEDFYLTILDLIEKGHNPAEISKELRITKQRLNYHLTSLKSKGLIRKLGYGVWERSKNIALEEVKDYTKVTLTPDTVRGHAFVIKYELPKNLKNWEKREQILTELGIGFAKLNILGNAQGIMFKDHKVWLTDRSIIVYGKPKESYFADNSHIAKERAMAYFMGLLRALESVLHANFGAKIRFKVSRQHYALVKNALAKQYDQEGKKLEVYSEKGLWFLIDNSFNLNEAETVHPLSAEHDNKKVQDFFNGLKQLEGFTPQFVSDSIGQVTQNQMMFAENMKSHIAAIQALASGVQELTKTVREHR